MLDRPEEGQRTRGSSSPETLINNGEINVAAKKTKKKLTKAEVLKANAWPPGVSGNPKGRPPNPISLTAEIKRLGALPASETIIKEYQGLGCDLPAKATWVQVLAARDWLKATDLKAGDIMAKEIAERIDGKVALPVTGTPDGDPVKFKFDFTDLSEKELTLFEKLLSRCQSKTT